MIYIALVFLILLIGYLIHLMHQASEDVKNLFNALKATQIQILLLNDVNESLIEAIKDLQEKEELNEEV